ncbi:polysaccharide deacetylase family protein, partial [Geodermatophilus sp. CPCC 205506]|uniref:polysaccharide deacetylase family protein n=1 Tax=Geodermatophilus sp. CPCC 205506 TaxID=2936596 RepID=UPI003EEE5948
LAAPVPAAAAEPALPPRPAPREPPRGVVDRLPGEGSSLALTIDDGTSSDVVASFCTFAADSGVRLTFFPNGMYRAWEENGELLQPLIDSGQVAMGNHTWSHPDITTLGDDEVAEEIGRNRDWLASTFGVRDTPFFRPPFGAHDDRTDRISAAAGHPTIALWNGTLGDHRPITPAELMAAAREWFAGQAIIVGHANQLTVASVYDELLDLIAERELQTVTLADVWAAPSLAHVVSTSGSAPIS